ncbi:LuxR family transcriptional regulator [Virgisporangium aurantiacum]|uniref:LuxR family transcriptional regulator n=1 Tax=Virgisporangium aurantiacum TaxID=175570 RepID=A0A8J3ZMW1_9ACTN|nr:LuxR family transcriptional regulator [Virgisporangium aurantiacum]
MASFVGRRSELREVRQLLSGSRLVTLVGVGGIGKTRLALRAAAEMERAFADGSWFVDLAALRDPGLRNPGLGNPAPGSQEVEHSGALAGLLAAVLGLEDRGGGLSLRQLTDYLAQRRALLVLDNCEHLLPACAALVTGLLRTCPALRVMATSREPLAVSGEVVFAVAPLPAPASGGGQRLDEIGRYDAVALFTTRARAVKPGFDLTAGNRTAIAEICRRLDGLPLAIELAAARIRMLSPQQLLHRLGDRFALLSQGSRSAPARQRTLRACVDWSFDLCSKAEQVLWARLSIFVGGFELDAVEGICTDELVPADEVVDLLAGLVDKSVVVRDDDGNDDGHDDEQARYRMLETIRDFGAEKLVEAAEREAFRRRHRAWYQHLVALAKAEWISSRQAYWMARLNREHPNLRAAVDDCLAEPGQAPAVLEIMVNLPGLYWWTTGMFGEGRRWLDLALARATAPTAVRARALLLDGQMTIAQNQTELGGRLLDEGEDLARRLDATAEIALAVFIRAQFRLYDGDLPAAMKALETSCDILSTVPQRESVDSLELRLGQLMMLGTAAGLAGDHDRADACFREVLAITEPRGVNHYRSYALGSQALSAWRQGRMTDVVALVEAILRLNRLPGSIDRYGAVQGIEMMAGAVASLRQYRRAATLLGAADALWAEMGASVTTFNHLVGPHETARREARAGLTDSTFAEAFTHGRAMSHDDAIAFALDEHRRPTPPPPAERSTRLTRRERQVADLLTQGLSNKEIASTLVISQRTAESHVENILAKLGFASRSQAAAWAASQQTSHRQFGESEPDDGPRPMITSGDGQIA